MTKGQYPQVAVIILNWNGKADTLECLASVHQLDYPNFEVIVVDNGSSDGSAEAIRESFPHIKLIENSTNLGFAAGNNIGIRYALGQGAGYVWLLNNDTTVETDSLSKLIAFAESKPQVGMLSPIIHYYDEPREVWFAGGVIDWRTGFTDHLRETGAFEGFSPRERYICGCALLVKRAVVEAVGLLDERFSLYYEDADWSVRATAAGFGLAVVEEARVLHKVGRSGGNEESLSFWRRLTQTRYAFMRKYRASFIRWRRRSFITGLAKALELSRTGRTEAAQGALDGLWSTLVSRKGARSAEAPRRLKALLLEHPYFWANLISGDWVSVRNSLSQKIWGMRAS